MFFPPEMVMEEFAELQQPKGLHGVVLVVCTGNVCRSPLAATLLLHRLHQEGYTGIRVKSAGTHVTSPAPLTPYTRRVLAERGFYVGPHRARQATREQLHTVDLILVMEGAHAKALRHLVPETAGRIHLISELGGAQYDIRAPYQGSLWAHRLLAEELASLIETGWPRVLAWVAHGARSR
ncbi:MAG: hypothetical protein Q9O62_15240 [Ardenticatenia bacterium]|nr:hypothetical protein [Ardenticatenia bacterium]